MRIRDRGFTLIEVAVVMAVLAILALMALPTFSEKHIKEQVVEALPLADVAKVPLALAWLTTQTFPADNTAAGLPAADKIVSNLVVSTSVRDGAIHITFGNKAHGLLNGKVLTLRPAVVEDAPIVPITWVCGYAAAPAKMKIKGVNKTDIPPNHLPLRCQS